MPPPPSLPAPCVHRVTPPDGSYPAPADTIPLSFMDANWIHLPYMQPLFLYPQPNNHLPFSSIVHSLKSSLSQTLLKFLPLAGRLAYLPSGNVGIDCTNPNVEFTVTESNADVNMLVGDPVHDSRAFIELVPEIDRSALPVPTMAVKVTGFAGGGVAVGLALHHAVMDGNGVMQFLAAWSAQCRGEEVENSAVPVHDRSLIRHPRGEEIARMFLKKKAPDLPKLPISAYPMSLEDRLKLRRRTFILSSSAIQSLKQHIINQSNGSDRPSTFTAISAFAWVCMAAATADLTDAAAAAAAGADVTTLLFLADCRSRLRPPIPPSYTGNCVSSCHVPGTWRDLLGADGISRAQAKIAREVMEERARDPLEGCEEWGEKFRRIPQSGRVLITGSPRFGSSQTDFGWGKPGRMELVSMNLGGEVILDARGEGDVQLSVALDPTRIDAFAKAFENQLLIIQSDETTAGNFVRSGATQRAEVSASSA